MTHDRSVEIRGLSHWFTVKGSRVHALDSIDFTLEPGQFLCLAGPSGFRPCLA